MVNLVLTGKNEPKFKSKYQIVYKYFINIIIITESPLFISFGPPPNPSIRAVTIDDFPEPLGPIIKFNFGWALYTALVKVLKFFFIKYPK